MPRAGEQPQAVVLRELAHSVAELRAELPITQAALAAAVADLARMAPDPGATLADLNAKVLGFANAAGRGLPPGTGRPTAVTAAASRFVDWAEGFLRARA